MPCEIELTVPNSNGLTKTFDSFADLDGYLYDHPSLVKALTNLDSEGIGDYLADEEREWFEAHSKNLGTMFEVATSAADTETIITKIRQNHATVTNAASKVEILPGSAQSPVIGSPTMLRNYVGEASNPDSSGKKRWTLAVKGHYSTGSDVREILSSSNNRIKIGNDFEKIFTKKLKGDSYKYKNEFISYGSEAFNKGTNVSEAIIAKLNKDHPNGKIMLQVPIIAKGIGQDFLDSIHIAMGESADERGVLQSAVLLNDKQGNEVRVIRQGETESSRATGADIDTITGVIDMLVINADGSVTIYDFKTYKPGNNPKEDDGYAMQLAMYRRILEQYGLKVRGTFLISVKISGNLDDDSSTDKNIDDITWSGNFDTPDNIVKFNGYCRDWLPADVKITYASTDKTSEIIEKCWPQMRTSAAERISKLALEEELKKVVTLKEDDVAYTNGYRYRYYKHGFLEKNEKPWIDAKTESEMKNLLEGWINNNNARRSELLMTFVSELRPVIGCGRESELEEIAKRYNASNVSYIKNAFSRYTHNGWRLVSDDLAIANGYLMFQKGDLLEIVVVSSHNLSNRLTFDHGKTRLQYTTVFGNLAPDQDNLDSRWVWTATYESVEYLRAMIFLSQHIEAFGGQTIKLNKIGAVSLISPGYFSADNAELADNYNRLTELYEKVYKTKLPLLSLNAEIVNPIDAFVNEALDILESCDDTRSILNSVSFKNASNGNRSLRTLISILQKLKTEQGHRQIKTVEFETARGRALFLLQRAILAKVGYQVHPDIRTGAYFNGSMALDGSMAKSPADSKSSIIRTLQEASYSFTRVCQTEFFGYTAKWKKLIQKWYDEIGYNKASGDSWKLYERFFEKDKDGKIDQRFLLKRKGSAGLSTTELQILDMFYEAIDRFKYKNNEKIIEQVKYTDEYRRMPLIRSSIAERRNKQGIIKAKWNQIKEGWDLYQDFLLGTPISAEQRKRLTDIDQLVLPEIIFDESERDTILSKKDALSNFTTDLDFIFNAIAAEGIKREHSYQFLAVTSSIRSMVTWMVRNGIDLGEGFENTITDFIKRKVFGLPIIEEGNKNIAAILNSLKNLVSTTALVLNTKSFVREGITGILRGFEKSKLDPRLKQLIDTKDYASALDDIAAHCYENFDIMSLHMQLNAIYGTSNFSYDQLAKNSTVQQLGFKNLEVNDLFFTATWPDFLHRNAIVLAYLKGIGAWDAHQMIDGVLTYDMSKDPRFNLLRKYKTREECPKSDIYKWDAQMELYTDEFNSWNNNGYRKQDGTPLNFGDPLPLALSPRAVGTLKTVADEIYGNYDPETRSLMRDKLLGSLFLQFKTYGINRMQEFFDGYHYTNQLKVVIETVKGEDGKMHEVWIVENQNKEAVLNGTEPAYVKKLDTEVDPELIKQGKAHRSRHVTGQYIPGGGVQQIVDMGITLFIYKNQEEFDKMWKENPYYRFNLAMFMLDIFGMALLAFIINLMYKGAIQGDYDEIDWFTQWSYNVAIGVAEDGPIWSVMSSIVGDGTPPLVGTLKSYANNLTSVITGKKNFLQGLSKTFGATRELTYLFDMTR